VHLGVYVIGASGVAHEADVALLSTLRRSAADEVLYTTPLRIDRLARGEALHGFARSWGRSCFLDLAGELGQRKCALGFPAQGSANVKTLIARKASECFIELIPVALLPRVCVHISSSHQELDSVTGVNIRMDCHGETGWFLMASMLNLQRANANFAGPHPT
jgi:hypothetical protein